MNSLKSLYEFKSLALVFTGVLIILFIFPLSFWNTNLSSYYLGILKPIIHLFVVVLIVYTTWWSYKNDRYVLKSWLLILTGMFLYFLSNLLYFIYYDLMGYISAPVYVDAVFLIAYPFLIIGLLLFLKKPYNIKFKGLLDVLIVMISAFFIIWFPFIWPIVEPSRPDTVSLIFSLTYIFLDLITLFVVLILLFSEFKKIKEITIFLLTLGLFAQLLGDMVYAYNAIDPTLIYKWLSNLLYSFTYLFISMTMISYLKNMDVKIVQPFYSKLSFKGDWISYLPLILVIFTYGLLIFTKPDLALIWGVGIIVILVILRHIISLNEIKKAQRTLKKNKEIIKNNLKEKETLLKEIHHRVKNNLQIISSLLVLQEEYVKEDNKAINVLKESQNRVLSLAMLHEMLYHSEDLSHINFSDYIKNLVSNLFDSLEIKNVTPIIDVDDILLNIETAVPCGLIISELVSNSLKYAYPKGTTGELLISLKSVQDDLELTISDKGIGFPEDLKFEDSESSLGLELVTSLVQQIDGTMNVDISEGTTIKIRFKELTYKDRF